MRDVTTESPDSDLIQWFFRCRFVKEFAGSTINAGDLVQAMRDLAYACRQYPGDANEVRLAYQFFMNVAGPRVVGQFLERGTYQHFTPYTTDPGTPSMAIVWEQGDKRVVARVQYSKDVPVDLRFDVEEANHGQGSPYR